VNGSWIEARVVGKQPAARDITRLVLEAAGGGPLPPFAAGAHIDIELPNGLIRQYSLCGSPACTERYELGILLEPEGRGGSRAVHELIGEGDRVRISPPRNLFPLAAEGHALLLAGGIGVTPILAMAERLHLDGRGFALHYCVRSADRAAFAERLAAAPYADAVQLHYDDRPDTALDMAALLERAPNDAHLYVCGPAGFIDFVTRSAAERGWPDARVHIERFAATPEEAGANQPFEIEIASSGQVITVRADQTAAAALAEAGIEIPLSCEQGVCGTCLTEVAAGVPDHRDLYLSADEHAANDCFTPCCSRALSARLVLHI